MTIKEMNHKVVLSLLPDRDAHAHKGMFGKILLLCGSRGFTGAAALAAMGALRTGAGLVYLGVPAGIYDIEATKLLEPVVFPLPDIDGMLSDAAVKVVSERIGSMDAVLIGPGLGQSEGVYSVVSFVLENFMGPVVLDADGLNVIARHKYLLRNRTAPTIITPHEGEFRRLGGSTEMGRMDAATEMARDLGVVVLLKGHNTLITDGQACYVNTTGNPGMAVGGSGDVLSGIIVSLLGQGLKPLEASAASAWVHGKAGDICMAEIGQYGMLPSDMLQVLPRLLK